MRVYGRSDEPVTSAVEGESGTVGSAVNGASLIHVATIRAALTDAIRQPASAPSRRSGQRRSRARVPRGADTTPTVSTPTKAERASPGCGPAGESIGISRQLVVPVAGVPALRSSARFFHAPPAADAFKTRSTSQRSRTPVIAATAVE